MRGRYRLATLCAGCLTLCAVLHAHAQTQSGARPPLDELEAARSLFAEALRDEENKRYLEALQKFQRVRTVRDTAPIDYRIGSCYEGLGRRALAYAAYRDATVAGQGDNQSAEVVKAAAERLGELARHVARLRLVLAQALPQDLEVRVDDVAVERVALRDAIPLEPGPHTVTATARDTTPFRSEIALQEGAQVSLTISLEPRTAPDALATAPRPVEPGPAERGGANRTVGWITVAGAGALLVGSGTLLLVRQSEISKLDRACPGGVCGGVSNRSDLESTRNRALIEGPVAAALGVAGIAVGGLGAYFLFTAQDARHVSHETWTRIAPFLAREGGGIAVAGEFQ
jgi:hypothetical protein